MRNFGLLFVVGEERNSAGAYHAAPRRRAARAIIINGEPTENKLALGSKGALRYEVAATGTMAHSAYPELGESAIDKLLDALADIRAHPAAGRSTARPQHAEYRNHLRRPRAQRDRRRSQRRNFHPPGGRFHATKDAHRGAPSPGRAELREMIEIPALRLSSLPASRPPWWPSPPISRHSAAQWGKPFLIGPGSIHVAHTLDERVPKRN